MAAGFPKTLKKSLRESSVDADVVIVRDAVKQENYENKVLDLLYPPDPADEDDSIMQPFSGVIAS